MKARNIGISVKAPSKSCEDEKCPFHGNLSLRGNVMQGKVVSTRAEKTAVIERNYQHFLPKFERYERRHSRLMAYKPECMDVKEGDIVTIAECRPLSTTKAFVVIEKVK